MGADGGGRCAGRNQFCHDDKALVVGVAVHSGAGGEGEDLVLAGNRDVVVLAALCLGLGDDLLGLLLGHVGKVIAEAEVGVEGRKDLEHIVLLGGGEVDERVLLGKVGVVVGHDQREHQVVGLHVLQRSWGVDVVPVVAVQGGVLRKLREGALIVGPDYAVLAVLLVVAQALIVGVVFHARLVDNRIINVGVRNLNPADGVVVGARLKFRRLGRQRFLRQRRDDVGVDAVAVRFQGAGQLIDGDQVDQLGHGRRQLLLGALQNLLQILFLLA